MGVWDAFGQGMELGHAMRSRSRQEQQQETYGQAFQTGGFGGVRDAAGGMGDMTTAGQAQTQVNQREASNLASVQRNATVLSNVATSLSGVPYETRRQRLAQMAHDGLARCINPIHTQVDGDTMFGLATGGSGRIADLTLLGALADNDVTRFHHIEGRFSSPVMPGVTLWRTM